MKLRAVAFTAVTSRCWGKPPAKKEGKGVGYVATRGAVVGVRGCGGG